MQKQMLRMRSLSPGLPTKGITPDPGGCSPPTTNPQVMPNAMMGVPPPAPTPQGGANVPPGTPRPGAQGDDEALRRMGLLGPRGE